jgi:hypothetical protein
MVLNVAAPFPFRSGEGRSPFPITTATERRRSVPVPERRGPLAVSDHNGDRTSPLRSRFGSARAPRRLPSQRRPNVAAPFPVRSGEGPGGFGELLNRTTHE